MTNNQKDEMKTEIIGKPVEVKTAKANYKVLCRRLTTDNYEGDHIIIKKTKLDKDGDPADKPKESWIPKEHAEGVAKAILNLVAQ